MATGEELWVLAVGSWASVPEILRDYRQPPMASISTVYQEVHVNHLNFCDPDEDGHWSVILKRVVYDLVSFMLDVGRTHAEEAV